MSEAPSEATPPDPTPEPQEAPQQFPLDVDQDKFLATLGIEPGSVVKDTVTMEMADGKMVVYFKAKYFVAPQVLAQALAAAGSNPVPVEVPMPADHKPPTSKRAAAKKAPTKKSASSQAKARNRTGTTED